MAYLRESMELNLFFLRILKEHALFMQLSFMPRDRMLAEAADDLGERLTQLFKQAIALSKGYVSAEVMNSGELFTRYTEEAERQMEFFTGLPMDLQITRDEYNLGGGTLPPETLRPQVDALNQNALALARQMQQFMQRVLEDVAACRAITTLYPTQIDHLARELHHYIFRLRSLMSGNTLLTAQEFADEQAFWNEIMAEHAEFIDGLLDPTEQNLKAQAEAFAVEFARLVEQLETAQQRPMMIPQVTLRDEDAMRSLQNFKSQATHGILSCKIRSIITPLLADHVLREANHYLRVLRQNM